ncbi:MAG: hypothetical protein HYU66_13050 [Armatimonadetes bacterium]|nr:hypothetical protein [Armatimonadota bacterium]
MVTPLLLLAAALAAPPVAVVVTPEARIDSKKPPVSFSVTLPAIAAGQQVRLGLDARVDWPGLDGSNPWMVVAVNGRNMLRPDLLNKPYEFTMRCGMDTTWAYGAAWRIVYAPDFTDQLRTAPLPLGIADCDPYHFTWDITPYAKAGENTVTITHLPLLAQGTTLVVRAVSIEIGEPVQKPEAELVKPAPDGPVPTYFPKGRQRVAMRVALGATGGLRLTVGKRTVEVASRTSEPAGKWAETGLDGAKPVAGGKPASAAWTGTGYRVDRRVELRDDHVKVTDRITNTGTALVGLIYENALHLTDPPQSSRMGGQPVYAEQQVAWVAAHPTVFAQYDDLAIGLAAEDDIYRVHSMGFRHGPDLGVSDPQLGLDPGASHTLEWSLYPVPSGDYWDVVNAIRRNWGSNVTIPGAMCFDHAADGKKSEAEYQRWVRSRGLRLVLSGQTVYPDGKVAEGTDLPSAAQWFANAKEWVRKVHTAGPDVMAMIYLHSQICTEEGAQTKYADSRLLGPDGQQVLTPYHYPIYIYLATLSNTYGPALLQTAHKIQDDLNADGFYLDEFEYATSQYAWGAPWDGCSVDVDASTHAVGAKKSSVTLLQQPWKKALIDYLRAHGKLAWANGEPSTRSMLNLKVPRFVESASYSFLVDGHLACPVGLGNHDHEPGDRGRAEMARRMLDQGGLLTVYEWADDPPGMHFEQVMFPTTILELHRGVVIAQERMVTNRSGRFGWPDGSAADVYEFDADGRQVAQPWVKVVRDGARRLTELRMASDHFAVLVRRR